MIPSDLNKETNASLTVLCVGRTLRDVAAQLGYPAPRASFLSDVLHGRTKNYSIESLHDLRRRLGLSYQVTHTVTRMQPPAWVSRAADWLAAQEKETTL